MALSEVVVRCARPEDREVVVAIHEAGVHAAFANKVPFDAVGRPERERRVESWAGPVGGPLLSQRHGLLVAEHRGRVVGFVSFGPTRDNDEDREQVAEVRSIFVAPDARGAGVGQALLRAAVVELRRFAFTEATLWMVPENVHARRFYDAADWAPDGREQIVEVHGVRVTAARYRHTP